MTEQCNGGYIRLYRRLLQNPIWFQLAPAVAKVAIYMLLRASYKPVPWYDGTTIPAGSFITSLKSTATACNVSVQQVRDAFDHLSRTQFATYRRTRRWTMVTVLNWASYQASPNDGNTLENTERTGQRTPIKKLRSKENSPLAPKGALAGIPSDPDELPFAAELDPILDEPGNGKNGYSAGAQNGNGHVQKSATAIQEVARRIHGRHPNNHLRRDCSAEQVEKKLAAIVKRKRVPADVQAAFLEQIDRNHAAMCASELWRKDDGQFVKGLEGWLAPTKERYLASPVVITADATEQRYVL